MPTWSHAGDAGWLLRRTGRKWCQKEPLLRPARVTSQKKSKLPGGGKKSPPDERDKRLFRSAHEFPLHSGALVCLYVFGGAGLYTDIIYPAVSLLSVFISFLIKGSEIICLRDMYKYWKWGIKKILICYKAYYYKDVYMSKMNSELSLNFKDNLFYLHFYTLKTSMNISNSSWITNTSVFIMPIDFVQFETIKGHLCNSI